MIKVFAILLLALASCDQATVRTLDGGTIRVYGEQVEPPPAYKTYVDPRPDVERADGKFYKTYIQR